MPTLFDEIISQAHRRLKKPLHELSGEEAERVRRAQMGGWTESPDLFHATREDIPEFDPNLGDIGTHTGTLDQAHNRLIHTGSDGQLGYSWGRSMDPGANVIPLVTRANNPLEMSDVGAWNNADTLINSLLRDPKVPAPVAGKFEGVADYIAEDREMYDLDEWLLSPENRAGLDDIRDTLQDQGYDSVRYKNEVETTQGMLPGAKEEYHRLGKQINDLQNSATVAAPMPDPRDYTNDDYGMAALQYDLEKWSQAKPQELPKDVRGQIDTLSQQRAVLREQTHDPMSTIVLDENDLRHPDAQYMPDGEQDMSLPPLLRGGAGAGLLAGGMMMGPSDAQAAMQDQQYQGAANLIEDYARQGAGFAEGAVGGDRQARLDIQEGRTRPDTGVGEAVGNLLGATFQKPLQAGIEALRAGGEDAYNYSVPGMPSVGERASGIIEMLGNAWEGLSDTQKEKTKSTLGGGAMLLDLVSMGAPAAARRAATKAVTEAPGLNMTRDTGLMERVTDPRRVNEMKVTMEGGGDLVPAEPVSIAEYEGYPWVSYMADTSSGDNRIITDINGVPVHTKRSGGQSYQRHRENVDAGRLWASARDAVQQMINRANRVGGGKPTIFAPYRMGQKSPDFSTMVSDVMLDYTESNMTPETVKILNSELKDILPDFPGLNKPKAKKWLHDASGPEREKFRMHLDRNYRDKGGLTLSEARAAIVDASQVDEPMGQLHNVGLLDATGRPMDTSLHNTYDSGLPGEFIGNLKEDVRVTDLATDWVAGRRAKNPNFDPYNMTSADQKSLQGGVGGIITEPIIKGILDLQEFRGAQ